MILTLSGADFAQNNIGKIDIPTTAITSIAITGSASVVGESSNYTCTATYEDNTTRDVTSSATWSVNNSYATISNGVLTIAESATTAQSVTITATYSGKSATKSVSVKYQDISELASAVLTAYGNKTLTQSQRKAVDTFVTSINNASYKSKINRLFMPILANDLSKATVDVMADNYAAYSTLDDTKFALDSNGVYRTDAGVFNIGVSGLKCNDFHIMSLHKKVTYSAITEVIQPMNSTAYFFFPAAVSTSGITYASCKMNNVQVTKMLGVTSLESPLNSTMQYIAVADGYVYLDNAQKKAVVEDSNDYPSVLASTSVGTLSLTGYQSKAMTKSQAVISIGLGLSDSELTAYRGLLSALATAFGLDVE